MENTEKLPTHVATNIKDVEQRVKQILSNTMLKSTAQMRYGVRKFFVGIRTE